MHTHIQIHIHAHIHALIPSFFLLNTLHNDKNNCTSSQKSCTPQYLPDSAEHDMSYPNIHTRGGHFTHSLMKGRHTQGASLSTCCERWHTQSQEYSNSLSLTTWETNSCLHITVSIQSSLPLLTLQDTSLMHLSIYCQGSTTSYSVEIT